jgi:hypothetical protein
VTKALALQPKGRHPLHILWESEVWPGEVDEAVLPGGLRERMLSGLPRMERSDRAWSTIGLRSDSVLQEIFHTEEKLTPADVPRRREVLAAWSMPLDLKQAELLEAASGAMDRAADAGGAGWGEPRGITLHLEVGNASLLRSDALQLLVLHEKRGFAPGVREKLTMALGAVARSLRAGA